MNRAGNPVVLVLTWAGRHRRRLVAGTLLRHTMFGVSNALAHKGAYGALFDVRCRILDRLARAPLGELDERSTGRIKTVLSDDVERLELLLAHNLPEAFMYVSGPVAALVFLLTANVPLALVTLVPAVIAFAVLARLFRTVKGIMPRATKSLEDMNTVMVEYITGMRVIKALDMGARSFTRFRAAVDEEYEVWGEMSRRTGPGFAAYVVIEAGDILKNVALAGVHNRAIVESMREFSHVSYTYERAVIPTGVILVGLSRPLLVVLCYRAWREGALAVSLFLLISMMPLLTLRLISAVFIDLTAYRNLRIARNNIADVLARPREEGSFDAVPYGRGGDRPVPRGLLLRAGAARPVRLQPARAGGETDGARGRIGLRQVHGAQPDRPVVPPGSRDRRLRRGRHRRLCARERAAQCRPRGPGRVPLRRLGDGQCALRAPRGRRRGGARGVPAGQRRQLRQGPAAGL